MKKCPFCAEEVQDAAIVCKHCGRELDPERVAALTAHVSKPADSSLSPPHPPPSEQTGVDESDRAVGKGGPRSSKPRTIWRTAMPIGFLIALVASLPSCSTTLSAYQLASADPSAILYARGKLQDLIFHFFTNWVIWCLIAAALSGIWRRTRIGAILGIFLILGSLATIAFWPEIADRLPSSRTANLAQTPTARSTPATSSTPVPIRPRWMTSTAAFISTAASREMTSTAAFREYYMTQTAEIATRRVCGTLLNCMLQEAQTMQVATANAP